MSKPAEPQTVLTVAALSANQPTPFLLAPEAEARAALARDLGQQGVRKLRFEGEVRPEGRAQWVLTAKLGATVAQTCVVSLEPLNTRIDIPVERRYLPASQIDEAAAGSEMEMPEDDTVEELTDTIDLGAVMAEALSLALPAFPRKQDAAIAETVFAEEGVTPMRDEDTKPFAGLAALKAKLGGTEPES